MAKYVRKTRTVSTVIAQLEAVAEVVPQAAPWAGAKRIGVLARRNAPKKTRWLMRNIVAVRISRTSSEVQANAEYSGWVEFGTRKMKARPYMRPAVDQERRETMKAIEYEVNQEIRRVLKAKR